MQCLLPAIKRHSALALIVNNYFIDYIVIKKFKVLYSKYLYINYDVGHIIYIKTNILFLNLLIPCFFSYITERFMVLNIINSIYILLLTIFISIYNIIYTTS